MRVETIANRSFAFGLTWTAEPAKPNAGSVRRHYVAADKSRKSPFYYCALTSKTEVGRYVFGGGILPKAPKGHLYSYAATLATSRLDGIYAARVDTGHVWFCVIHGGTVVPETDVIGTDEDVTDRIEGFRSLFRFPQESVFASEDLSLPGGSHRFDPADAIAHAKQPIQLRRAAQRLPIALFVVVAAIIITGVVGWKVYAKHKAEQQHLITTQQQRQQAITNYRNAVSGVLSQIPQDPAWASDAWRKALAAAPAYVAGWSIKSIDCHLNGCDAVYALGSTKDYAVTPFTDRFGKTNVAIAANGTSVKLHIPAAYKSGGDADAYLHNPPKSGMLLLDWVGLVNLHIPNLTGKPAIQVSNLGAQHQAAQLGLPSLASETVRLSGRGDPGPALIAAQRWAADAKLRISTFTITPDPDNKTGTWSITLLGLHG